MKWRLLGVLGAATVLNLIGHTAIRSLRIDPQEEQGVALSPELRVAVEAEVEGFLTHYIESLESGDEAAIRELFVQDDRFSWFTDGEKSYSSADDVLAGMQRFAGLEFRTTLTDVEVVILSVELASVRSGFETTLTIPGADDYAYGGVITWLVEKPGPSEPWRVLLGHTSTPGGPPAEER